MKILIIDDSPTVRLQLQKHFSGLGHEVICAETGMVGIPAAANESPDVIILDYEMPEMNGLEVLRELQSHGIPAAVVMLTGSGSELVAVKAMKTGAEDYVTKPYVISELSEVVHRVYKEYKEKLAEKQKLAQTMENLQTMSLTDPLTGLYNRRGFVTLAEQQVKIADRAKREMALFFIDLDDMKGINDTLGHLEGDKALINTAHILRKTFRDSDIIGRMGGDEFAVLALETMRTGVDIVLNRLKDNLEEHNAQGVHLFKLSLSVGFAPYDPSSPCSVKDLMQKADDAMYQNKRLKKSV